MDSSLMVKEKKSYAVETSNFDKFPSIAVKGQKGFSGWNAICQEIIRNISEQNNARTLIVMECYHGVAEQEIVQQLQCISNGMICISVKDALLSEDRLNQLVEPYVTDDPVFGYITPLEMKDLFDTDLMAILKKKVDGIEKGTVLVYGPGASLVAETPDLLLYADMPRWEIQLRFRRNEVGNLGVSNPSDTFSYQYKRAYFVDWRICDRLKQQVLHRADYVLDTTIPDEPKMISGEVLMASLRLAVQRPFRVVPFFDPGPWGGQWLKEVCDLENSEPNIAWGFDCVPEENSLLFQFDNLNFELPSINLVFYQPESLLGKKVYEAFGAEFPIRFDFLDTMEGGNLSLQVHPLKQYIREKFGMAYTQDESYYFLQAEEGAFVYLGLKEGINPDEMMKALQDSQEKEIFFDAEAYVEKWPVRQHDHVLIPAGTVHCSGANSVVLEISATPYIFTFKLWDWGRMGLDGKPRPISLEHGRQVIQWNRTTQWTKENIINQFRKVSEGNGWIEEQTGLHPDSFIETRRHWFTTIVHHHTGGVVNVLNLVQGRAVMVESPTGAFEPFEVHYAETFIVPAAVGDYTVRPLEEGQQCGTMKAYIRTHNLIDYKIN